MTGSTRGVQNCVSLVDGSAGGVEGDIHRLPNGESLQDRVLGIKFKLLHRVFDRGYLLEEKGFEIGTLVTFGFSLDDMLFDSGILCMNGLNK